MMVAIIHQAMIDDAVVAATGSDYTCKPNSTCANTPEFQALNECAELGAAYRYSSEDDVKRYIKQQYHSYGALSWKSNNVTNDDGPCPDTGKHYEIYTKKYKEPLLTVQMCPCCQDTPSGPVPQERWRTN